MKREIIIIIFVLISVGINAQPYIQTFPTIDKLARTEKIPNFGESYILNQYKLILEKGDTISSTLNMQIYYFNDREYMIQYDENQMLSYTIERKIVNDTTVIRTYRHVDEESVYEQISTLLYNKLGFLTQKRTITYESDVAEQEAIQKNEYLKDTLILRRYYLCGDSILQFDSLVYDTESKISEVHVMNYQYGFYEFAQYNYSPVNDELDNIKIYGESGNLLLKKTFPEGNRYRPQNEILIQQYANPDKSSLYAVETQRYEKSKHSNYTELISEKYHDHKLQERYVYKFDSQARIIELLPNHLPGTESEVRKIIYFYEEAEQY